MFSEAVLDHFHHPRNSGDLPGATATVDVTNPVCGDVLRLAARVADDRMVEVRFKAQGCVTAMACASALTEMIQGRELRDLVGINSEIVAAALGGLPPATVHGSQLVAEALQTLLVRLRES